MDKRSIYSPMPVYVLLLCCFCLLSACGGSRQNDAPGRLGRADQMTVMSTGARRADPGYVQYLERLSMLGSQTELARVVSGSQLAWLRPARQPFPDPLLAMADTWLHIDPLVMLPESKRSVMASLASPNYWQIFVKARLGGLYLSPQSGSGSLWAYNRKASAVGDDIVQYSFSENAGTDSEYFRLLSAANANKKMLGLEMVPAATGLGPDFFLATRYHRQYSGLYCMVELPKKIWNFLPSVSDEWFAAPLDDASVANLAAASLLPPAMAQDLDPAGKRGGWAVTGEIHGVDGVLRRWAYRYYGSPDRPVLNWEDPSAGARRVFSGSSIRNIGMLGSALVGVRLEGLYGLDAASPGAAPRFSAAPGEEAAIALSREVRRYGGWSWLKDELPLSTVASLLEDGPDFFQDPVFSPGIEHAILTASTEILEAMVDDALALGLDMRRFVHSTSAENGVSYALPHLADVAAGENSASMLSPQKAEDLRQTAFSHAQQVVYGAVLSSPQGEDVPPLQGKMLHTSGAGVAALALGKGNGASLAKEDLPFVRDGHFMGVFTRAMLPGLLMLSGQDLAGSLPLSWYSMTSNRVEWPPALASRSAYALTQSISPSAVTTQGVPRGKSIYPTPDAQLLGGDSFIARLARVQAARSSYRVAEGKLHGRFVPGTPGVFAYALLLPGFSGQNFPDAAPGGEGNVAVWERGQAQGGLNAEARKLSKAERLRAQHEENEARRVRLGRQIITTPAGDRNFTASESGLIVVCNFSRDSVTEQLRVSHDATLKGLIDKGAPTLLVHSAQESGGAVPGMSYSGGTISLHLPPWQAAAILIGRR